MHTPHPLVTIITPCYNESLIIERFLNSLEHILSPLSIRFHILVVNDGSTDDTLALLIGFIFKAPNVTLEVLDLKANCGHQSAIYHGLLLANSYPCNNFIIMDSDGEDAPATIPQLLQHTDAAIVHVVRSRRKGSVAFKAGYYAYKMLFRLLTGKRMDYGNFCMIDRAMLERAVSSGFSHFAAFLSRQSASRYYLAADRDGRLGGKSKMGFRKLLRHAINSFAEYAGSKRMDIVKHRS